MSAYFFSFPLQASLQQTIDNMLADHARGQYADSSTSVQLAIGTNDGIIQALALDVVEILKNGGESAGILDVLAKLLKTTMHGLIKGIMGKLEKGEQDKLAGYLSRRRVVVAGQTRFGFGMPEAAGARFEAIINRIGGGDTGPEARQELTALMGEFVDIAMVHFYDEFTGSLDLGFVKRKLVDVGRSTLVKGSHSATSKLFVKMTDEDLKRVTAHYGLMFVKA